MLGLSQRPPATGRARAAAALVAAVLCCVCSVPVSGTHQYSHQPRTNLDNLVGTVCEVPFGFLPLTCGDYEVIERRSEPVPIFKYGWAGARPIARDERMSLRPANNSSFFFHRPNVCRNTRIVRRNEREYRYQRYCDWVWDRYYYSWIQSCRYDIVRLCMYDKLHLPNAHEV